MSREMTNSEAIANLNHIYGIVSPDIQRSLDVAIKALEERPQGEVKKMENDLISRSKLLISVLAMIGHNNEIVTQDKVLGWVQGVDNCRELIENAPTVEPLKIYEFKGCDNCELERPHGEWIEGFHDHFETLDCSCCGYVRNERHLTLNFCPNCGADMRKPNCVRCDHFGDCDGCEKGEEE